MKTSWNQCTQFDAQAQAFLDRTKDRETKLSYAIKRVLTRLQKLVPVVKEHIADIEIEHCVVDEKQVITHDAQGNLQYTKEGIKARNTAQAKYLNESNVELEPHFATKLPNDLTVFEIEAFAGFVIKPEDAERLLLELESKTEAQPESNGHHAESAVVASVSG